MDPTTAQERGDVAQTCSSTLKLSLPTLVDDMKDTANQLYRAWPERMYVIGTDKRIKYKGGIGPFGFSPREVNVALRNLLVK